MALLEIRDLYRSFYGVHALEGAHLAVAEGTITGLIGPNGAGKTTLFNCVSGLVPPDRGSIVFAGRDITGWRPDRIVTLGLQTANEAEIVSGLHPNEMVVVSDRSSLKPGDSVHPDVVSVVEYQDTEGQ